MALAMWRHANKELANKRRIAAGIADRFSIIPRGWGNRQEGGREGGREGRVALVVGHRLARVTRTSGDFAGARGEMLRG
jgi:hypothetical protein